MYTRKVTLLFFEGEGDRGHNLNTDVSPLSPLILLPKRLFPHPNGHGMTEKNWLRLTS